ncbi:MAG: CDP-alcohol phosphatidyltransferase family protein [Pseudonocardiaceae bacterium]
MSTAAIVFATVACDRGTPAATLTCGESTLLGRVLEQVTRLGVERVWVVTRTGWEREVKSATRASALLVDIRSTEGTAEDLRAVAEIAGGFRGRLILASGDILTHDEALAGLLSDPRITSGILTYTGRLTGSWAFRTRAERGRVVSAGSPYHQVRRPSGYFLGVLTVDPRDRERLVDATSRMAGLAEPPRPERWDEAFDVKRRRWRLRQIEVAMMAEAERTPGAVAVADPEQHPLVELEDVDGIPLDEETERALTLRAEVSPEDALPLVLVGLVRSQVHLSNSYLRALFWARPVSQETVDEATERMRGYDEDRVLLDSAVKGSDGFFTTFFVSPYSKYIARWAARRGLTPNQVTTFSMALGAVAALAFATGSRAGLIAGALLLQAAFTFDCVDGQLARYTRQFSKLGAWLDSVFDRGKEYLVFAGLAIGATAGFGDNVWALAAAALALQTLRHTVDFSYAASRHQVLAALPAVPLDQPEDRRVSLADAEVTETEETEEPESKDSGPLPARIGRAAIRVSRYFERRRWMRWAKKIVVLPIGERFALISITAAVWEPRVTFLALLAWGSFALVYQLTGRVLRSVAA